MTAVTVRQADSNDAPSIAGLIRELAEANDEKSAVSESYVEEFLSFPGNGAFLAMAGGDAIGLLSYSVRPNLYHAGDVATIEELVVSEQARAKGIGGALLEKAVAFFAVIGCVEVSVSTMPDNEDAIRFYRSHGLCDEAVLLEKHY